MDCAAAIAFRGNYTDKDYIDFATNVECLEGLFDTWGTFGRGFLGKRFAIGGNALMQRFEWTWSSGGTIDASRQASHYSFVKPQCRSFPWARSAACKCGLCVFHIFIDNACREADMTSCRQHGAEWSATHWRRKGEPDG